LGTFRQFLKLLGVT